MVLIVKLAFSTKLACNLRNRNCYKNDYCLLNLISLFLFT